MPLSVPVLPLPPGFPSLADRLDSLPYVLAGPILRRVDQHSVTVWLVMRVPGEVTLRVVDEAGARGQDGRQLASGSASSIALGHRVHMVLVTAAFSDSARPQAGSFYGYDLLFDLQVTDPTTTAVSAATLSLTDDRAALFGHNQELTYKPFAFPTFVFPPNKVEALRILQGSCRKPHGGGPDALVELDDALSELSTNADRPQQLCLTGDQIYADDVDPLLLTLLMDAERALFLDDSARTSGAIVEEFPDDMLLPRLGSFYPGDRSQFIRPEFESGHNICHLMTFGEYFCMYLFVWSEALWPPLGDVQLIPMVDRKILDPLDMVLRWLQPVEPVFVAADSRQLSDFRRGLASVRRALANIATYMIWDDHELTDDWFISERKRKQCLNSSLSRRVLINGALSAVLTQLCGNNATIPDDLRVRAPMHQAMRGRFEGDVNIGHDVGLARLLGLSADAGGTRLRYEFAIRWTAHDLMGLDCRSHRTYGERYARLFGDSVLPAINESLAEMDPFSEDPKFFPLPVETRALFVMVPVPPLDFSLKEFAQRALPMDTWQLYADAEAWGLEPPHLASFLHRLYRIAQYRLLLRDVVILAGDVHYSFNHVFALNLGKASQEGEGVGDVWYNTTLSDNRFPYWVVFHQFTASPLKNGRDAKAKALKRVQEVIPGSVTKDGDDVEVVLRRAPDAGRTRGVLFDRIDSPWSCLKTEQDEPSSSFFTDRWLIRTLASGIKAQDAQLEEGMSLPNSLFVVSATPRRDSPLEPPVGSPIDRLERELTPGAGLTQVIKPLFHHEPLRFWRGKGT